MRKVLLGCSVALAVVMTLPTSAGQPLDLHVSPNVSAAPATLRVRLNVPRHSDNRFVRVEADSGDYYRSSEIQLNGEDSKVTQRVEWFGLPSGTYQITATLRGVDGDIAVDRHTVTVLAGPGEIGAEDFEAKRGRRRRTP